MSGVSVTLPSLWESTANLTSVGILVQCVGAYGLVVIALSVSVIFLRPDVRLKRKKKSVLSVLWQNRRALLPDTILC